MTDTRLSFTMRASVERGPAPPDRHGDGPLPPGCVRIPVSVQVALPPGVARFEDLPDDAALPVSVGPAAAPAQPAPPGRRLAPATGWPVLRSRGSGRPLPPEARLQVLNSLFERPGDARTFGFGPNGAIGNGLGLGELAAALRAMPGALPPTSAARMPGPNAPDPPSGFLPAGNGAATAKPPIPGLPPAVLRGPGTPAPPGPGGGSGATTAAGKVAAAAEIGPGG